MRVFMLVVLLVGFGACASAGGPEAGMPREGTAVVSGPVAPGAVRRLPWRPPDIASTRPPRKELTVTSAAALVEPDFRARGWSAHDPEEAVQSFLADTPDGWALFRQARRARDSGPKNDFDATVAKIAQSTARRGLVQVLTDPQRVHVFLQDVERGVTNVELWCTAGSQEIVLEKDGYKRQTVRVTVEPQKVTVVRARMARL